MTTRALAFDVRKLLATLFPEVSMLGRRRDPEVARNAMQQVYEVRSESKDLEQVFPLPLDFDADRAPERGDTERCAQ